TGKIIREGVYLVIAGKPNSGKSSLFNYFLKTNRSIVSKVAGTTRDYIEESIIINGVLFNLIDTAGLRLSDDEIESEGIRRSHKKIDEADLIVYLIDSSQDVKQIEDDLHYFNETFGGKRSIAVMSKKDLTKGNSLSELLKISLLEDETIEALKKIMTEKVINLEIVSASEEIILTNLRHKICLENVVESLKNAVQTIDEGLSGEFISVDLRTSLSHLGEITGEVTNDDILNNIFRNFCIGK
ncbi:MAG: GTPase, partial [bacterium]